MTVTNVLIVFLYTQVFKEQVTMDKANHIFITHCTLDYYIYSASAVRLALHCARTIYNNNAFMRARAYKQWGRGCIMRTRNTIVGKAWF